MTKLPSPVTLWTVVFESLIGGHCLALTLMGSYLADAYDGDIRCCKEVSKRLVTTYDRASMPER